MTVDAIKSPEAAPLADLPEDEPTVTPVAALSRNEVLYVIAMHVNFVAEYCDLGEGFTREEFDRRMQRVRQLTDMLVGGKS